jgi:ParB family transcriptional regulator, chromosome partitioning protein
MLGKGLESLIPPQKQPQQPAAASEPPRVEPSQTEPSKVQNQPNANDLQLAETVEKTQQQAAEQQPTPAQISPVLEKIFEKARPSNNDELTLSESVYQIEVEKIMANPSQPRRDFNQDALRDLSASIREFGLLQPLVVTKIEKETANGLDVEYQIIAGERRFLASKMLGLRTVPAIIRNVHLEREKLELAVIENIQRENLNPVETARAFQRLQEEFHLTQREIASKLGKSRETVANSVRLLDLPAYIQEALQKGELSESHGRLLLAIEDPAVQKRLFEDISLYRLTTRDVKDRVERIKRPGGVSAPSDEEASLPPEVRAMKESLSASLGAPVEIKKGVNTGRISITFYSEEELENILRRLGKEGM